MKKNKKMAIWIIIIFLLILIMFFIHSKYTKKDENNIVNLNGLEEIDKNQISFQENVTVNELKEEIGATGDAEIYETQTEYDGRKVLTVKAGLKYKVAFAGMMKKAKPNMEELDTLLNENFPIKNRDLD